MKQIGESEPDTFTVAVEDTGEVHVVVGSVRVEMDTVVADVGNSVVVSEMMFELSVRI